MAKNINNMSELTKTILFTLYCMSQEFSDFDPFAKYRKTDDKLYYADVQIVAAKVFGAKSTRVHRNALADRGLIVRYNGDRITINDTGRTQAKQYKNVLVPKMADWITNQIVEVQTTTTREFNLSFLSKLYLYLTTAMSIEDTDVFADFRYGDGFIGHTGVVKIAKSVYSKLVTGIHRNILIDLKLIEVDGHNHGVVKPTDKGLEYVKNELVLIFAEPLREYRDRHTSDNTAPEYAEGDFVLFYCMDHDCEHIGRIDNVDKFTASYGYDITEVYSGKIYRIFSEFNDIKRLASLEELKEAATCSMYHDIQKRINELEKVDTAPLTRVKTYFYNNQLMFGDIAADMEWVIQQLESRL